MSRHAILHCCPINRVFSSWWKVKFKPESQDEDGPSGLVPMAYVEEVCTDRTCVPATINTMILLPGRTYPSGEGIV